MYDRMMISEAEPIPTCCWWWPSLVETLRHRRYPCCLPYSLAPGNSGPPPATSDPSSCSCCHSSATGADGAKAWGRDEAIPCGTGGGIVVETSARSGSSVTRSLSQIYRIHQTHCKLYKMLPPFCFSDIFVMSEVGKFNTDT